MSETKSFSDIYNAVIEELGVPTSDSITIARIKRDINLVYQQKVVPYRPWKWLLDRTDVRHLAKYTTGTISVTEGSTSATLSTAPASTVGDGGSFLNYQIKIDGYDEIYTISAHTALATALTLRTKFNDTTNATATFRIYKDTIDLPTDCSEVIKVWHDHDRRPLELLGNEQLRDIMIRDPYREGYPTQASQIEFYDPTPLDGETESDRYRQLMLYPAQNNKNIAVHVDYKREVTALSADADEPLIPIGDRIVLVYGALARAWVKHRSLETYALNTQEYTAKLKEMAAKYEKGTDNPRISPTTSYMAYKRGRRIGRSGNR